MGVAVADCGSHQVESGIVVYSVPAISNTPVLPEMDMQNIGNVNCLVTIAAAKGEYEPTSIVVNSRIKEFPNATIKVTSLVGQYGSIGPNYLDVKIVKPWYQSNGAWFEVGRPIFQQDNPILVPELLLNDESLIKVDYKNKGNFVREKWKNGSQYVWVSSVQKVKNPVLNFDPEFTIQDADELKSVDLEKNKNKQLWITVHVPESVSPGRYDGKIIIMDGAKVLGEVGLRLNVRKFKLLDSRIEYSIYYHGRIHKTERPSLSSEYKSPEQLRAELKDMLEHGFKNPVVYQPPFGDANVSENGFKQYLRIRKEVGIDNRKLYLIFLNSNEVQGYGRLKEFENNVRLVKEMSKEYGVEELYIYGKDEAKGDELVAQRRAWEIAHNLGCKIFAAGAAGVYELVGDLLDLFISSQSPMLQEAKKFHSVNHRIFSYANPQGGVENPYVYRRNYGLLLWAAEFDGAMVYAYQDSMGDGWNDFDNVLRDHNLTYPTTDGVIKTIAWEGLREGIDDVRYVNTLEDLINSVTFSSDRHKAIVAMQARDYLLKLKSLLNGLNNYGRYTSNSIIDLDNTRSVIAAYIEQLM